VVTVPLPDATAAIVAFTWARPPTLGSGRLVCVDGPAGSGKTTLGAALLRGSAARACLVHMDDVFEGWTGLAAAMDTVASSVVGPLRTGRPGRYHRYDWHRMRFAEERVVPPCDLLVVEGVGSGGRLHDGYDDAITCLVWVDAPSDVRLERGLLRDGVEQRDQWLAWQQQEAAMFERERTRERADVVVDGTTGLVSPGPAG
jgi:uridine kinase